MQNDKLIPVIEEIKKWCKTNNIICFVGSTNDEPYVLFSYERAKNDDWKSFLEIAKQLDIKIITLEKESNDLKTFYGDIYEMVLKDDNIDQKLKKNYETALAHDNEIALIKLTFNLNEVWYKFSIIADWYVDYSIAHKIIEEPEDNEEYVNNSQFKSNIIISKPEESNKLTEQEIEEYSRMIAEHNDFIKAKNRIQKEGIVKQFIKEKRGNNYNNQPYIYWKILRKSEEIFELEIKPKVELEIKEKVLNLKAQGFKKIEIRSKLDISQGMVDRFYHME